MQNMQTKILGLLAETFIHAGAGSTGGVIDLPVAREAATGYPYIPGSSLKGALSELAKAWSDEEQIKIFGKQESAGGVLVSDARLLLLPVRSLSSAYRWVTCPHLLERLDRDLRRGRHPAIVALSSVKPGHYLGKGPDKLFLEERSFQLQEDLPDVLSAHLKALIAHSTTRQRITDQVVILHDDDFAWFARYGLAVQARNVLNDKKTSENLWYEETLPPDTLMYVLLAERTAGAVDAIAGLFHDRPYLQVGGNETVGQGWFAVQQYPSENGAGNGAV